MLSVGKILKTHALKGELKVQSYLDSPYLFRELSVVAIRDITYKIKSCRVSGEFVYVFFDGLDSIDDVQELVGAEILCDKKNLPPLSDGRYYIAELIGCDVFVGEDKIGKMREMLQNGSADVFVVKKDGESVLFPWIDGLVDTIDVDKKTINLNKKVFDEVAVYEN